LLDTFNDHAVVSLGSRQKEQLRTLGYGYLVIWLKGPHSFAVGNFLETRKEDSFRTVTQITEDTFKCKYR
jgi:hypothetical protein